MRSEVPGVIAELMSLCCPSVEWGCGVLAGKRLVMIRVRSRFAVHNPLAGIVLISKPKSPALKPTDSVNARKSGSVEPGVAANNAS